MLGRQRTFSDTLGKLTIYCNLPNIPPLSACFVQKSEYLRLFRYIELLSDYYGPQDGNWQYACNILGIATDTQDDPALKQLITIEVYDATFARPRRLFRQVPTATYTKTLRLRLFRLSAAFFTDEFEAKVPIK